MPLSNIDKLRRAIEEGDLSKIPKEEITLENLLRKGDYGANCLHVAAMAGTLGKIPKEFLTLKNLLKQQASHDWNCFQVAAWNGSLSKIPKELLTLDTLLERKRETTCALEITLQKPSFINEDRDYIFTILTPQTCIGKLKELNQIQNNLGIEVAQPNAIGVRKLNELVTKIETLEKLKKMPSLKI